MTYEDINAQLENSGKVYLSRRYERSMKKGRVVIPTENEINEIENKLDKIDKNKEYQVNTRFDSLKDVVKKYGINIKLVNDKNNSIVIDEFDAFKSLINFVRSAYAIK